MKLIEYFGEYESLLNRLEDCEENEEVEIGLYLNEVVDGLEDKLEKCAWMYRNLLAESEVFKGEAERLATKAKIKARQAEQLKDYVAYCLNGKSVKTKTFSLSFRKSESVEIVGDVPEQYQRVKTVIEPDKTLIKTDLKSGADLEFAKLVTKQNLQIR